MKKSASASNQDAVASLQQKIEALEKDMQLAADAKTNLEQESAKELQQAKAAVAKQQADQIVIEKNQLDQVDAMLKQRRQQQAMLQKWRTIS